MPSIQYLSASAFGVCTSLSKVLLSRFGATTAGISGNAFRSCYNLLSVYLFHPVVVTLTDVTAFSLTPIAGRTDSTGGIEGSIFVPESLYNSYISATNWATYSSRFVSLTSAQMDAVISGWDL